MMTPTVNRSVSDVTVASIAIPCRDLSVRETHTRTVTQAQRPAIIDAASNW
jgi:hypothetical protein